MVKLERGFVGGEIDFAGSDGADLVVAGYERAVLAAAEEEFRDAIGLVGGLDEHFFYAAYVVAD